MSLNEIRLPAFVIPGLYKNSLVTMDEEKISVEATAKPFYKFLGSNKKRITLAAHTNDSVFVNEGHLTFITKLLEACKMNIGDIAIVNNANEQIAISKLKKELNPKALILFGIGPTSIKLPIDFPLFKLQEYDGCTYLCAPSLDELDKDTNESRILKSKLWVCLKQLFEL